MTTTTAPAERSTAALPVAAPDASVLLDAWEIGVAAGAVTRPLLLLSRASPGRSAEQLADLPLGQRDAALLDLREALFGQRVVGVSRCPRCGSEQELDFRVDDIRVQAGTASTSSTVHVGDYVVRFRCPTSADLAQVQSGTGALEALFRRCVLEALRDGASIDAADLPDAVRDELDRAMSELDPQADVELDLACSACGTTWLAPFDIAEYLWHETDVWARRLLWEVHLLAAAYGWTEPEILRLGAQRRRFYLDLVAP